MVKRVIAIIISVVFLFYIDAGEKAHGVSIFGPKSLKYKEGEPFAYLHPDAPIAGRLKIPTDYFSKVTYFGLTGNQPRMLEHCYDTLGLKSWDDDEPYAMYGLIAKYFEIADDKKSMTIYLRENARFSDGVPVTADDVVFSYNVMFDPDMTPFFRMQWKKVDKLVKVDTYTVKVFFKSFSRDVPINVAKLIIFPKHIYGAPGVNLGEDFIDTKPVGSGPYEVESFIKGQQIVYKRRKDYWAQDLPVRNGMFNWERIDLQVYYDEFSKEVALKSGLLDFSTTGGDDAQFNKWSGDYFDKNYIVKKKFPLTRPSAMVGMAFNTRKPMFKDIRVRRIIASLYDFDTINKNFFDGSQERLVSFFHRQKHLRAKAGPAEGRVKEVLEDLAKRFNQPDNVHVPIEAITQGPRELGTYPDGRRIPIAERVHAANMYLDSLGWKWDAEAGARRKGDDVLKVEIIDWYEGTYHFTETLKMAGISATQAKLSQMERQSRSRYFTFDMHHRWMDARNAPDQEFAKHLLSASADVPGSRNLIGVKNPALDELLEKVASTEVMEDVTVYARAIDRILCAQCYLVPKYWPRGDNGIYWNRFGRPKTYASGLWFFYNIVWFWWHDEARAAALEEAVKAQKPFEFPGD